MRSRSARTSLNLQGAVSSRRRKDHGVELVEQNGGELPDVIVYPTGGGTDLVGMWKAFAEMEALGWIGRGRPRLISVQAEGCAPLVRAFEAGLDECTVWENPTTRVPGLRAPRILADVLCLRAVRESGGAAIAIPDEAMFELQREAGRVEGVSLCPEGGACVAALSELFARGLIEPDESVVVFNTASGLKYIDETPSGRPNNRPFKSDSSSTSRRLS